MTDRDLDATLQANVAAHEETWRHFDVMAERLEKKIDTVAEGVVSISERMERLEVTMKEEFAEVRAMI